MDVDLGLCPAVPLVSGQTPDGGVHHRLSFLAQEHVESSCRRTQAELVRRVDTSLHHRMSPHTLFFLFNLLLTHNLCVQPLSGVCPVIITYAGISLQDQLSISH